MSNLSTPVERFLQDECDALQAKLAAALWRTLVLSALLEDTTAELCRVRGERDKAIAERDHAREWAVQASCHPDEWIDGIGGTE